MFICKKCKKVDSFELMLKPNYQGEGKIEKSYDNKKRLKITIDDYTFVPDIDFMNNHAVCSYCGETYSWEYSK